MGTIALIAAMLKLHLVTMRSYWFNTVAQIGSVYVIFLMIFMGARSLTGGDEAFGDTLSGIVVGSMVFTFLLVAFAQVSNLLMEDALQGTLEHIAMSPLGLTRVMLCRVSTSLVPGLVVTLLVVLLMMASTGKWLHLRLETVVPLLLLTASGLVGVGFALGGMAILIKRIQGIFDAMNLLVGALVVISVETLWFVKFLPVAWGTTLIKRVMIQDLSIVEIPVADLAFLLANSAAYFAIGIGVFRLCEARARERGVLGHY